MKDAEYEENNWAIPGSKEHIHYRFWKPRQAQGLLVVIHGFAEHGGRYLPVAEHLAGQGFCVAVADLPGHGLSSGSRGDIPDVASGTALFTTLTEQVFLPSSGQSAYSLYGHSFGGLFAIRWAMNNPKRLKQLVVQSPLLETAFHIPTLKKVLARLVSFCYPATTFTMDLDAKALSHDPAIVEQYRKDPLVHNKMTARCYWSILATRDVIMANPKGITQPTLLLYGTEDRVVDVGYAQRWFDSLSCKKQCRIFPGAFHELHHEPVRGEVLEAVASWVKDES